MLSPCLRSCLIPAVPGWPWPWFLLSPVPGLLTDAVTSPGSADPSWWGHCLCWSYPWPLAHPPLGTAPPSLFPDKQDKSLLNLQQDKFWITIKKTSQLWPFFKVPFSPNFPEPVRCLQQTQFNLNSWVIKLNSFGVFCFWFFFPLSWVAPECICMVLHNYSWHLLFKTLWNCCSVADLTIKFKLAVSGGPTNPAAPL